ncbi:hypothetical protein G6011_10615 [Alternaria panax]|uniref:Uncharacterized protein n=1 Tax=Alternaria panax TaxID=48097 RepID=A0AAD4ICC5_9PLEO|nr:hypothetical protein G6011_10615 [Alternaria panax]
MDVDCTYVKVDDGKLVLAQGALSCSMFVTGGRLSGRWAAQCQREDEYALMTTSALFPTALPRCCNGETCTWTKSAAKGGALMCGLDGSDQIAGRQIRDTREPPSAASRYNSDIATELENWYWRETNPSDGRSSLFGC